MSKQSGWAGKESSKDAQGRVGAAATVPAPPPAADDDDDDSSDWMLLSEAADSLATETTPGSAIGGRRLATTRQ